MPRNLRRSIILALLFSVIFPWTLMAEAVQQAPRNSLSYFLESEETGKEPATRAQSAQPLEVVKTPETISNEPQPEPGFEVAPPEAAPEERIDRFAAVEEIRARLAAAENLSQHQNKNLKEPATDETAAVKVEENKPAAASENVPEPVAADNNKAVATTGAATIVTPEPVVKETAAVPAPAPEQIAAPAPETGTLTAATDEYVPFAGVLARMQQNKAKRTAEAQKLGVVLPSQGGDIATVSPSLSRMNQAIKDIMNR